MFLLVPAHPGCPRQNPRLVQKWAVYLYTLCTSYASAIITDEETEQAEATADVHCQQCHAWLQTERH